MCIRDSWITDSKPVKSIFKAEQGGEVIRTGETILAVPVENYAFWQWSDGCRQRARRQNFSGQEIWAQFVPVDAVVTVQQNSKKHVVSWCAVRDQQLKFRPSASGDDEKTICDDWSQPKPQFSDWQQQMCIRDRNRRLGKNVSKLFNFEGAYLKRVSETQ